MAVLELPVRSDIPAYEFSINLEDIVYRLRFRYNARMKRWFFDIKSEDGEDLLNGLLIITGWGLADRFKDERLPPGTFMALDTEDENKIAERDDFGSRVLFLYIESV